MENTEKMNIFLIIKFNKLFEHQSLDSIYFEFPSWIFLILQQNWIGALNYWLSVHIPVCLCLIGIEILWVNNIFKKLFRLHCYKNI